MSDIITLAGTIRKMINPTMAILTATSIRSLLFMTTATHTKIHAIGISTEKVINPEIVMRNFSR